MERVLVSSIGGGVGGQAARECQGPGGTRAIRLTLEDLSAQILGLGWLSCKLERSSFLIRASSRRAQAKLKQSNASHVQSVLSSYGYTGLLLRNSI